LPWVIQRAKKNGMNLGRDAVIGNEFSEEGISTWVKNLLPVLVRRWYGVGTALVGCLFSLFCVRKIRFE